MKRIALLLLTTCALIASGCGGNSDENDYVKEVNAADIQAQAAFKNLGTNTSTPKAAAKSFDSAADKLEPVVAEYKAIDPPENAASAHAKTIAGVEGLVALMREIADDFRSANTASEFNEIAERTADITSEKPFRQLE
ncbi:MAG TPA: hypothetical protein VNC41_15255, partial [Acidimicrobiia bacterium]|nr:hypothetical protein [Acidimicrobiia bacterium]